MDGQLSAVALRPSPPQRRGLPARRPARGAAAALGRARRDPGAARHRGGARPRLPPVAGGAARAASSASTSSSPSRASSSPRCCCARLERAGSVSLRAFWARRARRILPAALLTLLVCALATVAFVPLTHWQQFFAEMRASTAYVQNWQLAGDAVDYFAAANAPVARPALLVAVDRGAVLPRVAGPDRRRPARHAGAAGAGAPRGRRGVVLAAATGLSLVYSILHTAADPAAAYFVTPTRAWELGAGALLALAAPFDRSPAAARAVALLGRPRGDRRGRASPTAHATPFPGHAALLPVLGALAVIRAGTPAGRWSPARGDDGRRPVQFLGDVSYSVYLWHWPLIVFAPFVVAADGTGTQGRDRSSSRSCAAWLTKRLVEDPARTHPAADDARGALDVRRRGRRHRGRARGHRRRPARTCTRAGPRRGARHRSACSTRPSRAASAPPRATPAAGRARTPALQGQPSCPRRCRRPSATTRRAT